MKHKSQIVKPTKSEFERFENFARALIAVPHKEIQDQLAKPKRKKRKLKKAS
jgi:hypothetical protein